MKRTLLFLSIVFFCLTIFLHPAVSQITTLWELSRAADSLPDWFGTNTERGMDFGIVDGNERVLVVSRSAGMNILLLDPANGEVVGDLDMSGIAGGVIGINDVGISDDGVIFAGNVILGASASDPFKIYRWDSVFDQPQVVIEYSDNAYRLGDKITVVGSAADNTLIIYAAAARSNRVLRFTTDGNGQTFSHDEITLSGVTDAGIHPSVGPVGLGESDFLFNASGVPYGAARNPGFFEPDGSFIGMFNADLLNSNSIRYFEYDGEEYAVTFLGGLSEQQAVILRFPENFGDSPDLFTTPSLGSAESIFESGDVAIKDLGDGMIQLFVLAGNNGIAAYEIGLTGIYDLPVYYVGEEGTGPAGTNPHFNTLKAAIDTINALTFTEDVTLYITSNLTEDEDVYLGVNTNGYSLTIKPVAGVSPTVEFTRTEGGGGGGTDRPQFFDHFIIGTPTGNEADLIPTHNVIIDGSNTPGGTTRDLTVLGSETAGVKAVVRVVGNNENVAIKNSKITNRGTATALGQNAVYVTNFNDDGTALRPDNLLIYNNELTSEAADAILFWHLGSPATGIEGMEVRNNHIVAGRRGINSLRIDEGTFAGNTFTVLPGIDDAKGIYLGFAATAVSDGTFNIYNNKFTGLSSNTGVGLMGIDNQLANLSTVNIYNNFFAGFEITADVTNIKLYAVRISTFPDGTPVTNVYHNSIYITDLTGMTVFGSSYIAGVAFETTTGAAPAGTGNIMNNIIYVDDLAMKAYGIRRAGTGGTFNSNYNNIYVPGFDGHAGYYNGTDAQFLSEWQFASGSDANSVSKEVSFVSETDLRLTGESIGDNDLGGTPIEWITTDIDGNDRHPQWPYMGAYEGDIPLSVERIAERGMPDGFSLQQNYPNPFNPATTIEYTLPQYTHVRLTVYNIQGQRVKELVNEEQAAGVYQVTFDASGLASGVYIYRIVAGSFVESKRMAFLK